MPNPGSFEYEKVINATGMQVLFAFLDVVAIKTWWGASNVVVEPRPGGLLLVEWEPGHGGEDDLLGPLGGVLGGILDKSQAGYFVHFGALHWLSPRGESFGPTRLEINVTSRGDPRNRPTLVRIVGSAFQSSDKWDRYFELTKQGWQKTSADLKTWCETQSPEQPEQRIMGLGDSYLAEAILRRRSIS
ncbi:MAG: hypothetical protein ACE5G2_13060 [Candidatus Krumholzibacteriia bacterium]